MSRRAGRPRGTCDVIPAIHGGKAREGRVTSYPHPVGPYSPFLWDLVRPSCGTLFEEQGNY